MGIKSFQHLELTRKYLRIIRRVVLNDPIDGGYVEASSCHISAK